MNTVQMLETAEKYIKDGEAVENPEEGYFHQIKAQSYTLLAIAQELKRHNDRIDEEIERRETMNMAESLKKLGW